MRGHVEKRYTEGEDGRLQFTAGGIGPLTGSGTRDGDSGKPWKGFNPTERNRHWAIPEGGLSQNHAGRE
jgi:site-specific DNA-methyltransferase (adenine-specific)